MKFLPHSPHTNLLTCVSDSMLLKITEASEVLAAVEPVADNRPLACVPANLRRPLSSSGSDIHAALLCEIHRGW